MTGLREGISPRAHSRANERAATLDWAARLGAVSAVALAARERSSVRSARAKLAAAERDGLLRRTSLLRGSPALYTATRSGLRLAGLSSLGACRVSASNAAHLSACAAVAAALELRYPDHVVGGERELRRDEREAGMPLASARLAAPGAHGRAWHRPDLVLWPAAGEDRPTAVEVELTVKAPRRLDDICRAWARARCVAGVLYLAVPSVKPAIERAVARADADDRVLVLALADVIEPSDGWTRGRDPYAREPSQGGRTVR